MKTIQVRACLLLFAAALVLLTGCGKKNEGPITSLEQLAEPGRRIGTSQDSPEEDTLPQDFPNAEIISYRDVYLGYADVASGRLDAMIYARVLMEKAIQNGGYGVRILDGVYSTNIVAVGISPRASIPDLTQKINAFIAEKKADGTLDDMYDRWVLREDYSMPEIPGAEHPWLTLRVATAGTIEPYSYYVGTELSGYDIELAKRFAAWLGAELEFKVCDFGGIVAAAQSGSVDCIMSNLYYTPERAEQIPYSDPLFVIENTAMVRDSAAASDAQTQSEVRWQDYNGKRIGVLIGPLMEDAAAEFFPDSEYYYFNSYPDCAAALMAGKIDGFLGDEPGMISLHAQTPEIDYIHERLTENNYSFAFRRNDPESAALCGELNEFLAQSWADGTMNELADIWLGVDESKKTLDMSDLTGPNGTIRVVTTSTDMPWSYIKDGQNVGYDIDLVVRFCRERGYALKLGDVDFAGRIPAVQSGRFDFSTDMNVTPEREEQVLFSNPTAHGGIVLAILASDLSTSAHGAGNSAYESLDDFSGKRIGVVTGAIQGPAIEKEIPTAELSYFNSVPDLLAALKLGKIDAFSASDQIIRYLMIENDDLTYLDEALTEPMETGAIFSQTEEGAALRDEFNDYLAEARAAGVLEELDEIWLGKDETRRTVIDISGLSGENGTLVLATDSSMPPNSYIKGNEHVGMDIDLVLRFCASRGYDLEIVEMSFSGLVDAVASGKVDFAAGAIAHTPERAESVFFSDPVFQTPSVIAYLKTELSPDKESGGFFSSVALSFEKTFLRENRWQLFLSGIGTTFLITALSILFGTLLGFLVFMLCRNGNPAANTVTRFFVWLVRGMPAVVLLMILYYIIFGKVAISGTAVSVIGFTLVFGAGVYGMIRSGVGAVDRGQLEAAYTLGYTNRKAFFRVILPQAMPHFMPAYKSSITELIKATAIVGYVAVQDLTKMGDIVRSRTYEAFFPLIAVAIIYFVLAAVLTFLVNRIELRLDTRQRSPERIRKEVTGR